MLSVAPVVAALFEQSEAIGGSIAGAILGEKAAVSAVDSCKGSIYSGVDWVRRKCPW
jgi:hypothetical protein